MSKTHRQLCLYFQLGTCKKGDACTFSHQLSSKAAAKICTYYLKGNCTFGEKCLSIHESRDQSSSSPSKTLCSFFAKGHCKNGPSCQYLHDAPPPTAIPKGRETCSFYAAGDCSKGEACNFAHARTDSGVKSPAVLSALSTPSLNEISRDMSHSSKSTSTPPDSDATLNEPDSRGLLLQVPDRREAEQSPSSSHGSTSSENQNLRITYPSDGRSSGSTNIPSPSAIHDQQSPTSPKEQSQFSPQSMYPTHQSASWVGFPAQYIDPNSQNPYQQRPPPMSYMTSYGYMPGYPMPMMPMPMTLPAPPTTFNVPSSSNESQRPLCQYLTQPGGCPLGSPRCTFRHRLTPEEFSRASSSQQDNPEPPPPTRTDSVEPSQIQEPRQMRARPCAFFASGNCNNGDQCTYSHEFPAPEVSTSANSSDSYAQQHKIQTKCHFYEQGSCRNGDLCPYLHEDDKENKVKREQVTHRSWGTPPCKYFSEGNCRRGENCNFAHDMPEGHDSGDSNEWGWGQPGDEQATHRSRRTSPCKYFSEGNCRRGENCNFAHDMPEGQTSVNDSGNSNEPQTDDWGWGQPGDKGNSGSWDTLGTTADQWDSSASQANKETDGGWGKQDDGWGARSWDDVGKHQSSDRGWGKNDHGSGSSFGSRGQRNSRQDSRTHDYNSNGRSRDKSWNSGSGKGGEREVWKWEKTWGRERERENQSRRGGYGRSRWGNADPGSGSTSPNTWNARLSSTDLENEPEQPSSSSTSGIVPDLGGKNWSTVTVGDTTYKNPRSGFEPIPEYPKTLVQQQYLDTTADPTRWGFSVKETAKLASSRSPPAALHTPSSPALTPAVSAASRALASEQLTAQNHDSGDLAFQSSFDPPETNGIVTPPDSQDAHPESTADVGAQEPASQYDEEVPESQPNVDLDSSQPMTSWADDVEPTWAADSWGQEDEDLQTLGKFDRPCLKFAQGHCPSGDNCIFLHIDQDDLAPEDSVSMAQDTDTSETEHLDNEPGHLDEETEYPDNVLEGMPDREHLPLAISRGLSIFQCRAEFGAGASCMRLRTPFESSTIHFNDLPIRTTDETISELVQPFGNIVGSIDMEFQHGGASARVEFSECADAADAAAQLNGTDLHGTKLSVTLETIAPVIHNWQPSKYSRAIRISYPTPSRLAWAYYDSISDAKTVVKEADGKLFEGKKISVTFPDRIRKSQGHSFPVKVDGLPISADKASVTTFLSQVATKSPSTVHVNVPTYTGTDAEVYDGLRGMVEPFGQVEELVQLAHGVTDKTAMALVRFASEEAAVKAVNLLHNTPQDVLGNNKISVRHVYYFKVSLSLQHAALIEKELSELKTNLEDGCTIYWESRPSAFNVFLYSLNPMVFERTKRTLVPLVHGKEILDDEGKPLWDSYFDHPNSTKHLEKLNGEDKVLILDFRVRRILVLGDLESARQSLFKILKSVGEQQFTIDISEDGLIAGLLNGGFQDLDRAGIGSHKISLDPVARSLLVRGKIDLSDTVNQKLDEFRMSPVDDETACKFCSLSATHPIILLCSHKYCRECLLRYFRSMINPNFNVLRCLAVREDGSRCDHEIPFHVIQDTLSEEEQNDLFEFSFLRFIHSNPEQYRMCPILGCEAVYRVGRPGTALCCPACMTWICAHCHVELHEGLNCDEYSTIC